MFIGMLDGMKEESVGFLFNVTVEAAPAPAAVAPVAAPDGAGRVRGRGRGTRRRTAPSPPRSGHEDEQPGGDCRLAGGLARQGN